MNHLNVRPIRFAFALVGSVAAMVAFDLQRCEAQFGYHGRGGLRYRGPVIAIEVAPAYGIAPFGYGVHPYDSGYRGNPYDSAFSSTFDRYRMSDAEFFAPNVYDRYRGVRPTQAEIDRERYYYQLDRMHRYQTREERYENDFRNAYTPAEAMVNRYRYPYVAGSTLPLPSQRTAPVPGLSVTRHQSRYQGYVDDDHVAEALRAAAIRLKQSLARKADGHIWIRHLDPDRIIDSIDRTQFPGELSDLTVNYEGVNDNPRLVLISESEGFQDVRRLLAQYVTMNSTYPSATPTHDQPWAGDVVPGSDRVLHEQPLGETVVGESVLGERIIEQVPAPSALDQQPMLSPPSLTPPAVEPNPSAQVPSSSSPSEGESSLKPQLDALPDEADLDVQPMPETLPAPIPDAQ